MLKDVLTEVEKLDEKIHYVQSSGQSIDPEMLSEIQEKRRELLSRCKTLTPGEKVYIARHPKRPHIDNFIAALFTDFFEQKGDHLYDEDRSIYGGVARFHGLPVTVLGHQKGREMEEKMKCNFGMPSPEGYRKALRMMEQAEKFRRPIITFVDTPGAYPGLEAEEHGQGEAIARNLAAMSSFHVPIITVVSGEGNSGGALAISVANRILMLENAVYAVLSPEGFSSILWKDASRHEEAAAIMKLTAEDLLEAGVADEKIGEPYGGAQIEPKVLYRNLDEALYRHLKELLALSPEELREQRIEKYRNI